MPEIRITDDQKDRLQGIQEALREEVVGKYGHVRPRDALEYLLDRYETDSGRLDADVEGDASAAAPTDAAGGASPSPEADPATDGEATTRIVGERDAGSDAEDGGDGDADDAETAADPADSDSSGDDSGLVGRGAATARVVTDDEDADADADEDDDGSGMLNSMMNLANEHDDKWRESDAGEERYEVELPDGTTEPARTKDDVRALLFKHYR